MDLKIRDKVAVITAASKGLGRAAAEALAAEGVHLAICSRDQANIEQAAETIRSKYDVQVLAAVCDVTDKESVNRFKERVIDHFQTCHILFTNAGGPPPGKVEDFQPHDFDSALRLNLTSTIDLIYAFLPSMKSQKWGRIIASTSISVKQPIATLALSNVSRVGVIAFIKTLSAEVGPFNITANSLAPGYIMTERVEQILKGRAEREKITYDKALADLKASIPVQRIASPEEFGALAAYLSSNLAGYITGETILIDGGMYKGLM